MSEEIKEAFFEIVKLAERLGLSGLNKFPGCWEHQVDGQWWIALNAHKEPMTCSMGAEVPPFHAYVQFNGWPAGVIDPRGGIIAAGKVANEDTFIEALKAAGMR